LTGQRRYCTHLIILRHRPTKISHIIPLLLAEMYGRQNALYCL